MMNPIKQIIDAIKFVVNDFWTDIKFIGVIIKKVARKEEILDPEKVRQFKEELKEITLASFLKDTWHWLIVIVFAVVMGWLLSSQYYEAQCNNFVIENFIIPDIEEQMLNMNNSLGMFGGNVNISNYKAIT